MITTDIVLHFFFNNLIYFICFLYQFLATKDNEVKSIFDDVQSALSTHAGEMAIFARELWQVSGFEFYISVDAEAVSF